MHKRSIKNVRQGRLIAYQDSKSPITERYRSIRTNLEYAQIDKKFQRIVITSANPSEGKSTTISNLAVTYAQQGKRTILIDADLRKPNLHKIFGVQNTNGLTDVLMKKLDTRDAAREIRGIDGLFLMSAGFTPVHPAELLASHAMHQLINDLSKDYDIILIDTPPVLVATDAQIVSSICEAVLLVIKSGTTERKDLLDAKRKLEHVNANLVGAVLNQMADKKDNSYYQYK